MTSTDETFGDVPTELCVSEGRVSMSADDDATVRVQTPDTQPLSIREPEFTLFVSGDGFEASVSFDGEQAAVLEAILARRRIERRCSRAQPEN